jgi:RNA polymerase sigma-70 factor (ECF subfamily)
MQNDLALIIKLKSKDESALSQLYDNYSRALYGVILRMCKNEQDAQNLLQDTFLTIWEKSYQYNPEIGKFYTWAYRIAKNKTLNFLRKDKKLIQTEDLSVYEKTEGEVKTNSRQNQLKGKIKQLELHHQRAIELVYFNGLTHMEAHQEMEVPLGTFKSYIKQALKKLKISYIKVIVWIFILNEIII